MTSELTASREDNRLALAAALAHAPDGLFAFDASLRVTVWNAAMEVMTGTAARAVLGATLDADEESFAPAILRAECERTLTGEATAWLHHVEGADGSPSARVLSVRCNPIHDAHGAVVGGVGTVRDISEQWRTREALEEFRAVVEQTAEGVVLADHRGRITWANLAWQRMTGWSLEEAVGRTPGAILQSDATAPTTRQAMREALRAGCGFSEEMLNIRRDGTPFWSRVNVTPLRAETGVIRAWVGVKHDVTEARERESKLRADRALASALLSASLDGMFAVDRRCRILEWNRVSELWSGLSRDAVLGRPLDEVLPIPEADERRAQLARLFEDGRAYHVAAPYAPPGSPLVRFMETTVSAVRDESGAIIGARCTGRDVTEQRRAEDALRASEARAQAIVHNAANVILGLRPDGGVFEWNTAAETMFGVTKADMLGQDYVSRFVAPDQQAFVRTDIEKVLRGTPSRGVLNEVTRPNGATAILRWNVSRLDDGAGRAIGLIAVGDDITEQHNADERFRILFETSAQAIFLSDETGVLDCNDAAVHMIRARDKAHAVHVALAELLPTTQPSGQSSTVKRDEMLAAMRQSGQHRTDWLLRRLDGSEFHADVTTREVRLRGRRMRLAILHDVSERRTAELEVAAAWARLHDAVESLDAGFIMFDDQLRLVTHNAALCELRPEWRSLLVPGVALTTLLEATLLDGRHPITGEGGATWIARIVAAHRAGGGTLEEQVRGRSLRISIRRSSDGGTVVLVHDVTPLKAIQTSLEEARDAATAANEAKSAFLARMSHELRTPLNSIIGFTTHVRKKRADAMAPVDVEYLRRVEANGLRLLALVNDILDLAKVEAGKLEVHVSPTDLEALVHETVSQCEGYPRAAGVVLRAEVPSNLVLAVTDGPRVRQILLNLISNALKFTTAGEVVVRVVANSMGVVQAIQVSDTGCGIPTDRLEAIFGTFEQAHATTARDHGGSGLGLSIARALSEALGMRLEVTSSVGAGTTFHLVCAGAV